ncbi:hypothetical protein BHQ18_09470 [Mycolicibacterium flavescens]|uniref:Uncharacterized protein n=1 Tax=Mycolicibacterium flavescens TaxID=1776 RepID=A0A1E3RNC3_MYCFV|nr:hypothetical protein BHQ18_09470 [Mycolicibacterium flavescens]
MEVANVAANSVEFGGFACEARVAVEFDAGHRNPQPRCPYVQAARAGKEIDDSVFRFSRSIYQRHGSDASRPRRP